MSDKITRKDNLFSLKVRVSSPKGDVLGGFTGRVFVDPRNEKIDYKDMSRVIDYLNQVDKDYTAYRLTIDNDFNRGVIISKFQSNKLKTALKRREFLTDVLLDRMIEADSIMAEVFQLSDNECYFPHPKITTTIGDFDPATGSINVHFHISK